LEDRLCVLVFPYDREVTAEMKPHEQPTSAKMIDAASQGHVVGDENGFGRDALGPCEFGGGTITARTASGLGEVKTSPTMAADSSPRPT